MPPQKTALFPCMLLFTITVSWSQAVWGADVRDPGTDAPLIDLQGILQAPQGTSATLPSLRGKVVVLEFWATWCSNCVKAVPHFNALVHSLKGQPVVFIAVTDEDEAHVAPFLAKTPIEGWIGLNTTGSMIRSYGIHTGNEETDAERPLTVVIRPDGKIDSRLRPFPGIPFPLTAESLLNLAHGKPSGLASDHFIFAGEVHDQYGKPVATAQVSAREILPDGWREAGRAITDQAGHFKIERAYPLAFFSSHPILLQVEHQGFAPGQSADLRALSIAQQRDLHIDLVSP